MRTTVRILRGPSRGRTGWIAGELDNQNPNVRKVPVFCAGDVVVIAALADLAPAATEQLDLQLASNAKKPAAGGAGGGFTFSQI